MDPLSLEERILKVTLVPPLQNNAKDKWKTIKAFGKKNKNKQRATTQNWLLTSVRDYHDTEIPNTNIWKLEDNFGHDFKILKKNWYPS